MRLAVCWPWTSPFMFTDGAQSLLELDRPAGYETRFFRGKGWSPARRHVHCCEQALEWDAELILILGSDQLYEPDLLQRLVARIEQGYEIVAAMVPSRGYISWQPMRPFQPAVYRFARSDNVVHARPYRGMQLDSDMIEILEPKEDMERINFCGSGVLLFQRDHLLALKKPWFAESVDPETQNRFANMDSTFVWRLQSEAHATVWCDTTIKVRHLHIMEVDETFQARFADMQQGTGQPAIVPAA